VNFKLEKKNILTLPSLYKCAMLKRDNPYSIMYSMIIFIHIILDIKNKTAVMAHKPIFFKEKSTFSNGKKLFFYQIVLEIVKIILNLKINYKQF
jgi:hypothetical protein